MLTYFDKLWAHNRSIFLTGSFWLQIRFKRQFKEPAPIAKIWNINDLSIKDQSRTLKPQLEDRPFLTIKQYFRFEKDEEDGSIPLLVRKWRSSSISSFSIGQINRSPSCTFWFILQISDIATDRASMATIEQFWIL